jgi:hypothetical protein
MKLLSGMVVCSLISIGLVLPVHANQYRKKYLPYQPKEAKNDSVRNLTKIGLGVGLVLGSGVTGKFAYDGYNDLVNQGSVSQKGISGAFWAGWDALKAKAGYEVTVDVNSTQQAILKKFGLAVFWGMATVVLGASGLRLIHQGLAKQEQE